jgi:hypothetical protein
MNRYTGWALAALAIVGLYAIGSRPTKTPPAHTDQWWVLEKTDYSSDLFDRCAPEQPIADLYSEFKLAGWQPGIVDDGGDEVIINFKKDDGKPYHMTFFRSEAPCKAVAKANRAAADAAARAEGRMLDPYR